MKTQKTPIKNFFNSTSVEIGKFLFSQHEHVEWNNNKYSKGWHRKYGGVKEVSDRRVNIYKIDRRAKDGKKLLATVEFDAWRGNILLAAIKNSGLFTEPNCKNPLSIRLDKWYDAKLVRVIGNIKIYERTLIGGFVDYCAVLNKITFHAKTMRESISGLNKKIKAATKKLNEPISYALCKKLGFCENGIRDFCETFSLDIDGTYSPQEVEKVVSGNISAAAPFESELRTMAKALNYHPFI